jgi:hypothetical protein
MTDKTRRLAYTALWLTWSVAMGWGALQWWQYQRVDESEARRLSACEALIDGERAKCVDRVLGGE